MAVQCLCLPRQFSNAEHKALAVQRGVNALRERLSVRSRKKWCCDATIITDTNHRAPDPLGSGFRDREPPARVWRRGPGKSRSQDGPRGGRRRRERKEGHHRPGSDRTGREDRQGNRRDCELRRSAGHLRQLRDLQVRLQVQGHRGRKRQCVLAAGRDHLRTQGTPRLRAVTTT
jgi:hypothetical protein